MERNGARRENIDETALFFQLFSLNDPLLRNPFFFNYKARGGSFRGSLWGQSGKEISTESISSCSFLPLLSYSSRPVNEWQSEPYFFTNRLGLPSPPKGEPSLEQEMSLIFTYTMGRYRGGCFCLTLHRKVVLCGKQQRQQTQNKLSSNVREAGLTGYFDTDAVLASSEQGIFDTWCGGEKRNPFVLLCPITKGKCSRR